MHANTLETTSTLFLEENIDSADQIDRLDVFTTFRSLIQADLSGTPTAVDTAFGVLFYFLENKRIEYETLAELLIELSFYANMHGALATFESIYATAHVERNRSF
jgi:hypothetical protein